MSTKSVTPTRWEYLRFYKRAWEDLVEFNRLGREGWELVCVAPEGTFVFKRPVQ